MFSKTTKTISLVLISSALVFTGWGTPGCTSGQYYGGGANYGPAPHGGHYGGGTHFWWFHSSSHTYSSGPGGHTSGGGSVSGGKSSGGSSSHGGSSVSGRGGFGSSGTGVGA